ncbi:oxidoreductase [candidate division KSB1 bacterium]|nr:oxidoreductase [candidate division KSB1 bacterium]
MAEPIQSFLPLILILLPILGAIFTVLFGFSKFKNAREITTLIILVVEFFVAIRLAAIVFAGNTVTALGQGIFVDGLSALIILLVDGMVILITLQSIRYMKHERELGLVTDGRLTLYYALILLFTGTMNWTVSTNHMVMLYVAMEGTTLATALLVAFYRKRASLEAGYKYVLLVVVGITFALLGIVLIFSAAYPHLKVGAHALLLTEIGRIAQLIPKNIALLGVAFMTVGFATKAGLVPFHAWLPDAHSEAPSPISALLSGLIINIGAYALARTVTIFAPTYNSIVIFIAILSSASMLIGIFLALVQDDLKRMLAYSSVSQIAYVFEGLGLGTYLGIYGGLFHLVNHTLIKGLLFMSVGAIMYATGGLRKISQLGGLAKKMPITAFCFVVGALAIGGLPPFNGFMSKFTLFFAVGEQGIYWAMVISILTGLLTLACLVSAAYRVFWRAPSKAINDLENGELKEVPFLMYFSIVLLALLCILIGVYPQILYPILDNATRAVLSIWSLGSV